MSNPVWLMIMDCAVMGLLVATLYFAIRLSRQLRDFRADRQDLDKLVSELGQQVTKAENAIQGMKENARNAGRELQKRIDDAKSLSDELQMVSEAGNSMATRLERGASKAVPVKNKVAGFAIRDSEFEDDQSEEGHSGEGQFASRAEKELYEALRAGKNQTGAGRKQ